MSANTDDHYDILIAGAGFAGSLTALVLNTLGFKVCLLEKGRHPRFAIGESSTPLGDIMLRDLSAKYHLPWLHDFSRYGTWQQSHPEIVCGIKRGFSFFKHYPGKAFTTDENHTNELLVAASNDNMLSDTNWLRADFDSFLVDKVNESGIDYFDLAELVSGKWDSSWEFTIIRFQQAIKIHASFFIDATGSPALLNNLLGIESSPNDFLTDSFALFSHFHQVPYWTDILKTAGISVDDYPYNPDLSALHHILDEGWLWALRFNDQRTSLGFVLNNTTSYKNFQAEKIWDDLLAKYPTMHNIFQSASLAARPGKIIRSARLQRKIAHCFGPGWVALPHTAGFVDPLFSTGIAYSLSGIEQIIPIITAYWKKEAQLFQHLKAYELAVFDELELIDQLVAGCYKTIANFELFNTWSMLYFAITVHYESYRIKDGTAGCFLHADHPNIKELVEKSYKDLGKITDQLSSANFGKENIKDFTDLIRERIKPFNTAGLLDPTCRNMYRHTAAEI